MQEGRGQWGSMMGFVLASAGSAIGLGNLWKFPYITWHNQGGAFVLVYLMCILAVGLPIMIAEVMIGRKTQRNAVGALREAVGPMWGWVGRLGVFTGFVIFSYYCVVAGWSVHYFIKCVGWSTSGYTGGAAGDMFGPFIQNGGAQIGLAALFLFVTAGVVFAGVSNGIERLARTLMPTLFVILIILLLTATRMSGAGEAVAFIFRPNFSELPAIGILEALGHSFFTLSLGMGAMITYGSYMQREDSVVRSAAIIVLLDTLIAIVATIIMFAVIFSVAGLKETISGSTAGMLFVTLPEIFYTNVPFGRVLAPLFYVLVGFAALTSTVSILEVITAYLIEEHGWGRHRSTVTATAAVFVISIFCALSLGAVPALSEFKGMAGKAGVFDNLDHLASNWLLPLGGFFVTLAAGWGMSRAATEAELETAEAIPWFRYGVWRFFIRYVAPVAVAAIIVAVISGKDFS